jgi:hypothetical protein
MKFASPKHTRQEIVTLTAQFGVTFGGAFVEKARLIVLKYRKTWREHATYRAAIDNQIAAWAEKHGTRPVMYSVV